MQRILNVRTSGIRRPRTTSWRRSSLGMIMVHLPVAFQTGTSSVSAATTHCRDGDDSVAGFGTVSDSWNFGASCTVGSVTVSGGTLGLSASNNPGINVIKNTPSGFDTIS